MVKILQQDTLLQNLLYINEKKPSVVKNEIVIAKAKQEIQTIKTPTYPDQNI